MALDNNMQSHRYFINGIKGFLDILSKYNLKQFTVMYHTSPTLFVYNNGKRIRIFDALQLIFFLS